MNGPWIFPDGSRAERMPGGGWWLYIRLQSHPVWYTSDEVEHVTLEGGL